MQRQGEGAAGARVEPAVLQELLDSWPEQPRRRPGRRSSATAHPTRPSRAGCSGSRGGRGSGSWSTATLLLAATLAERLGIEQAADALIDLGERPGAAHPGRKLLTLVHPMLAGGDCIDDADLLRCGQTASVLGHRVMAPSTLGTFLRSPSGTSASSTGSPTSSSRARPRLVRAPVMGR